MAKFCCLLMLLSVQSIAMELKGEFIQGGLVIGKVPPGTVVMLDEQPIQVAKSGDFAFGFGRDEQGQRVLKWKQQDQDWHEKTYTIQQREYAVQHINGLPSKMVSPDPDVLERIRNENRQVADARKINSDLPHFADGFIWAAEGPISGVYGSQRVLNGKPKRPHFGVDVAGPVGTPVVAPADGVVTLWHANMYYSGGTMIIDHGMGVSSTFLHLDAARVSVGDKVVQGQHVADMGATGRVTGAHLDWRINWFNVRLDPALLLPKR